MAKPKRKPQRGRRRAAKGGTHLGKDEEYALIAQAQAGDERAMTTLLRKHHGFVCMMALRYRGNGLENEDLVQAGLIGMTFAIRRFDASHGTRLTTYANWWIRAKVNEAVVEGGYLIHLPQRVLEHVMAIAREARKEFSRTGGEPTEKALRRKTGLGKAEIAIARDAAPLRSTASLDVPATTDERMGSRLDALPDEGASVEDMAAAREERERLSTHATAVLSPVELAIIRHRYVDELTLEDVATRIAPLMRRKRTVSRERVRQIEERALCKLRVRLTGQGFA